MWIVSVQLFIWARLGAFDSTDIYRAERIRVLPSSLSNSLLVLPWAPPPTPAPPSYSNIKMDGYHTHASCIVLWCWDQSLVNSLDWEWTILLMSRLHFLTCLLATHWNTLRHAATRRCSSCQDSTFRWVCLRTELGRRTFQYPMCTLQHTKQRAVTHCKSSR